MSDQPAPAYIYSYQGVMHITHDPGIAQAMGATPAPLSQYSLDHLDELAPHVGGVTLDADMYFSQTWTPGGADV